MSKNKKRIDLNSLIGAFGLPKTVDPVSPGAKLFQRVAQYRMAKAAREARKKRNG